MSTSSDGRAMRSRIAGIERVPAGEHLRVLVAAEELDRLLDRAGPLVLEGGGDHAPALAAACTARTMLW